VKFIHKALSKESTVPSLITISNRGETAEDLWAAPRRINAKNTSIITESKKRGGSDRRNVRRSTGRSAHVGTSLFGPIRSVRSIKRQDWRKGSNPRQAALCSGELNSGGHRFECPGNPLTAARDTVTGMEREQQMWALAETRTKSLPQSSVWLWALGQSLRAQYEALAAPMPLHLAALANQFDAEKQR
jgi:hypothetical protein